MTEMQRQLEEWCESIKLNQASNHPHYDDVRETAWQAWQASRAAVVVKLPDTHNDWLDKQIVQYAIEVEGLRYE